MWRITMSELQVPDFNTLDDFTNWVKKIRR